VQQEQAAADALADALGGLHVVTGDSLEAAFDKLRVSAQRLQALRQVRVPVELQRVAAAGMDQREVDAAVERFVRDIMRLLYIVC